MNLRVLTIALGLGAMLATTAAGIVPADPRIRLYPARGFQIEQEIPDEVWQAYERLVALGYTGNLIPG